MRKGATDPTIVCSLRIAAAPSDGCHLIPTEDDCSKLGAVRDDNSFIPKTRWARRYLHMWKTTDSEEIPFTPYKKGKANIKRIFTQESGCKRFTGFGLLEIPPGGIFPAHTHPGREEIYHVAGGAGHIMIGDKRIEAKKGLSLYVSGDVPHGLENQTDKTLLVMFVHAAI